MATINKEL